MTHSLLQDPYSVLVRALLSKDPGANAAAKKYEKAMAELTPILDLTTLVDDLSVSHCGDLELSVRIMDNDDVWLYFGSLRIPAKYMKYLMSLMSPFRHSSCTEHLKPILRLAATGRLCL
jgi:hypothetical protein